MRDHGYNESDGYDDEDEEDEDESEQNYYNNQGTGSIPKNSIPGGFGP